MIDVKNLCISFDQKGIAGLHSISFNLLRGQILSLLGPNGSGKTTLLKIINRDLIADKGIIETSGKVIFFSQNDQIIDKNVLKLLIDSVQIDIDPEKKIQLARDLAQAFEFTFQLRQNFSELSSGQRQKVRLAQHLINRPEVILLDEPFAHLDPFTRQGILRDLFEYVRQQNITLVWASHEIDEAFKYSDLVALLNYGRIEQQGSPFDFIKAPKNLFVAQFVGYQNFFALKFENGSWKSPWGPVIISSELKNEGLLVVPDDAWEIVGENQGGIKALVTQSYPQKQCVEYELDFDSKKIYLKLYAQSKLLTSSTLVYLRPYFDECFIIPL